MLLDRERSYRVQARLSWGLGPVGPLPDVAGLGLRVLDADGDGGRQDLLLDSCLPPPRDRLLVLRRDLAGWYGTPLRLRLGGPSGPPVQVAARVTVGGGARVVGGGGGGGQRLSLDGARVAAAGGRLRVVLVVHDRRRVLASGRIEVDEVADPANPARPRFDMAGDAGGLCYAGFWFAVRQRTYAASRQGDPRVGTLRQPDRRS